MLANPAYSQLRAPGAIDRGYNAMSPGVPGNAWPDLLIFRRRIKGGSVLGLLAWHTLCSIRKSSEL